MFTYLVLILFFQATAAFCYLSQQEEKMACEKYCPPEPLRNQLDLFFSNSTAQNFFITRNRLQYLPKLGLRQFSAKQRLEWINLQKQSRFDWDNFYSKNYDHVCKTLCIKPLVSLSKNTFVFSSETYFPGYVLKLSKSEWIDFEGKGLPEVVRYKNISRVFYNDKLQEFIKLNNTNHLQALNKYLYHLPGQPQELSDRNYCVIAEKVENLPTPDMSKDSFKAMFNLENLEVKKEYISLIQELVRAVFYTGIADLRPHNIFLLKFDELEKILIIDTERHGFYDSDKNFFHKSQQEIRASAQRGLFNFSRYTLCLAEQKAYMLASKLQELLPPPPEKKKKVKTKKETVPQRKKRIRK